MSDYKWSHLQRLEKVLSDDDIIIFPINTIRTVKIMELSHICKIVNYLKKDNDYNSLAKELKKILLDNKKLILNSLVICPGVDTTILRYITVKLLIEELTEEEKRNYLLMKVIC